MGVRRLIIDESSKLKNHASQIAKACIEFSDYMQSVYLLSGTPAPNSEIEYWAQMRCIDKQIFGDSFYRFANEYFAPQKRNIKGRQVVLGYRMLSQKRDDFFNRLSMKTWSLKKEDAIDLPEQVEIMREVELDANEYEAYQTVQDELRLEMESDTLSVRAEAAVTKLRQLCGGWMYGRQHEPITIGTSKLDALSDLLDEIGTKPIVIWVDFRHDGELIEQMIRTRGETVNRLDGSTTGDTAPIVAAFQAGQTQRLVCHPASVGHGVTLTRSNYAIFYTLPWSAELKKQAMDRIHRKGQTKHCTAYWLVAEGTIEKDIVALINDKEWTSTMITDGVSVDTTPVVQSLLSLIVNS
jgi:SNF2 family DNA or RNA helicase